MVSSTAQSNEQNQRGPVTSGVERKGRDGCSDNRGGWCLASSPESHYRSSAWRWQSKAVNLCWLRLSEGVERERENLGCVVCIVGKDAADIPSLKSSSRTYGHRQRRRGWMHQWVCLGWHDRLLVFFLPFPSSKLARQQPASPRLDRALFSAAASLVRLLLAIASSIPMGTTTIGRGRTPRRWWRLPRKAIAASQFPPARNTPAFHSSFFSI